MAEEEDRPIDMSKLMHAMSSLPPGHWAQRSSSSLEQGLSLIFPEDDPADISMFVAVCVTKDGELGITSTHEHRLCNAQLLLKALSALVGDVHDLHPDA